MSSTGLPGSVNAVTYRAATAADARTISALLVRSWGGTTVAVRGAVYDLTAAAALVAVLDGQIVGLLTYQVETDGLYVLSLDALHRRHGLGTGLLQEATARARHEGCRRLWLTTTNDNLDALRFYQRRGLRLTAIRPDAVAAARRLKPTIPLTGDYGIAIRDELDLELPLSQAAG